MLLRRGQAALQQQCLGGRLGSVPTATAPIAAPSRSEWSVASHQRSPTFPTSALSTNNSVCSTSTHLPSPAVCPKPATHRSVSRMASALNATPASGSAAATATAPSTDRDNGHAAAAAAPVAPAPTRAVPRSPDSSPAAPLAPCTIEEVRALKVAEDLPANYDALLPDWSTKRLTRRAGIILHPTSLPGPYGIGELGNEALKMLDWLEAAGMTVWQILPMVPPDPQFFSPYSGTDANSGNPLLISIDTLIARGLLDPSDAPPSVAVEDIDFEAVAAVKTPLLRKAAKRLLSASAPPGTYQWPWPGPGEGLPNPETYYSCHTAYQGYLAFRKEHASWIENSAAFDVARNLPGLDNVAWWDWPEPLRLREPAALKEFAETHNEAIDEYIAIQYMFDKQWADVKAYANARSIQIVGDMPIYVGGHSADVWANQNLFELRADGHPEKVSGVPPDMFSETGQLWGSPLYRWPHHEKEIYSWWSGRLGRAAQLYDVTRIDHFRGIAGYWTIDASEKTAMNGVWKKGPGVDLFNAISKAGKKVQILAEDLGVITEDVVELREQINAPGMAVLQFAFGGDSSNVHLPHLHYENMYAYPGTHDNETMVGWYKESSNDADRTMLSEYLGSDGSDIAWDMIKACMNSVACTSIFMMQDVMRLDNSARMNRPGVAAGNWRWRIGDSDIWAQLSKEAKDLRKLTKNSFRLPAGAPNEWGLKPKGTKHIK